MGEQVAARYYLVVLRTTFGGVAQLGEHLPCKQGVRGSNPLISTHRSREICGGVALFLENFIQTEYLIAIKY